MALLATSFLPAHHAVGPRRGSCGQADRLSARPVGAVQPRFRASAPPNPRIHGGSAGFPYRTSFPAHGRGRPPERIRHRCRLFLRGSFALFRGCSKGSSKWIWILTCRLGRFWSVLEVEVVDVHGGEERAALLVGRREHGGDQPAGAPYA